MSCDIYLNNTIWGSVAAAGFGFGILMSYVPQQVAIVVRQSTEGINPYFLFLMNLGSSFAFANVCILSRPIIACCISSIGAFDCFSSLLGTVQLFAAFLGPVILQILAVRFRENGPAGKQVLLTSKLLLISNFLSWLLVVFTTNPVHAKQVATFFGLAALTVGFVQYIPQLLTTYRLKHTGSLSVTMMLIQIPGGYIWCLSLAMRRGSHWSTWVSTFAAATFQLTLLILSLYYTCKESATLANRLASPITEGNTNGDERAHQRPVIVPNSTENATENTTLIAA